MGDAMECVLSLYVGWHGNLEYTRTKKWTRRLKSMSCSESTSLQIPCGFQTFSGSLGTMKLLNDIETLAALPLTIVLMDKSDTIAQTRVSESMALMRPLQLPPQQ